MAEPDFLNEGFPSDEPVAPIAAAPEPVSAPVEAPTPKAPVEAPVAIPVASEAPKPDPGFIPLSALMDERDKRKSLEARLAQFEQAREAPKVPDVLSDPEGFQAHTVAQFQAQLVDTKLNISEAAARRHYGADKVEAAKQWALTQFEKKPSFQQEVISQADPYDYAIQQFERDSIASTVTADDFEQFKAWKAAQAQLSSVPASAASQSTDPVRSIASQPSGGGVGHTPVPTETDGFNGLFT